MAVTVAGEGILHRYINQRWLRPPKFGHYGRSTSKIH